MDMQQFKQSGAVSYEEYTNIKNQFGHVGSFGYFPIWKKEEPQKPAALLVDNRNDYSAKLAPHLNKQVVLMGFNFGVRLDGVTKGMVDQADMTPAEIVAERQARNVFGNQYGYKDAQVYWSLFQGLNKTSGTVDESLRQDYDKPMAFDGAYMTDFFKFPLTDKALVAPGMATHDGGELKKLIRPNFAEVVDHNIAGLKKELSVLDNPDPAAIVLLGRDLVNEKKRILPQLQAAFPDTLITTVFHYTQRGKKTMADVQESVYQMNDALLAHIATL